MAHQSNLDDVNVARALLAAAATGFDRLESAAHLAARRLAALTGMLARLEEVRGPSATEAGNGAAAVAALGRIAGPERADGAAAAQAASSPEERARQRTRWGLAPPREIYDVRNRHRVDWSTLPEWAMAPDPDIF